MACNSKARSTIIYEDTGTNPDTALSELQTLAAQGVKFIIGPVTSAELKNIMNYAQSNQIIVVSASSTSMELAVNKPFVFITDDNPVVGAVVVGFTAGYTKYPITTPTIKPTIASVTPLPTQDGVCVAINL